LIVLPPEKQRVTSYALDRSVLSWVARPESAAEVREYIEFARAKRLSICPAGGRNSFSDVFLLGDHLSLDLRRLDRVIDFDPSRGTITVEAGALTRDILALVMPVGWHLASTSGSPWNTVGGDLSSNVNGKDSWHAGTFGDQVESFEIVLADSSVRRVDRDSDPALFNAVIAGLGLLGVVTQVTLRLKPIPSLVIEERSRPAAGIAELIDAFLHLNPEFEDFSYAWVDAFPNGRAFARAVRESARFVDADGESAPEEFRQLLLPPTKILALEPRTFWRTVNRSGRFLSSIGLHSVVFRNLNRAKYFKARLSGERVRLSSFAAYQFPMTRLFPDWNQRFAPEGFNEVQALFPAERFERALRKVVATYVRYRRVPEVCGVRRHTSDSYDLSFAGEGLSFAIAYSLADFRPGELVAFQRELVDRILTEGGKVYLSKFPYLEPDAFRQMYPKAGTFLATKRAVDPDRLFWSDAAERLLL